MKVIIGCDSRSQYIGQLTQSLSGHQEVEFAEDSLYKFWRRPGNSDTLYVQWPEALYNSKSPQAWALANLADMLDEWSSKGRIVTTVHN